MEQYLKLSKLNRVGYITINRPKANSYEIRFMEQLIACMEEADADPDIKVIVVRSALDRYFCAGADIKVWASNTTAENQKLVEHARKAAGLLSGCRKITIAAISGHALGGGLELALACDMRLASEGEYYLGLPEVNIGLIPGNGGTQRLIRLIGTGRALEMLVTGAYTGPGEAHTLGLVNHVFPSENFLENMENYAEKVAGGPLEAMAAIKICVAKGMELSLEEGLSLEASLANQLYETDDAKEGSKAFIEKRKPEFK